MAHFPREEVEFLRAGLLQLEEYQTANSQFLDRMRHVSCFDQVQRVKGFVSEFYSAPRTPEEASSAVRDFVEEMAGIVSDHPLWREDGEDGYNQAAEALEKYVLHRLYKQVFPLPNSTDAEDDNQLYLHIRQLQFIHPEHLDIPDRPLNKVAFHLAAEELAKLDSSKFTSPWEKLACILNCISILTNLLKHYEADEGTGADEILPYVIYTLLLLSPKHMHSNLRYIQRFRSESKLRSEAAYYYTQMESAVLFITGATQESFSISQEEFTRGWREGGERLNSGKDVPTFIPRTYLWSRRDSSPPKSLTPAVEGGRRNFSFNRGSSVEVMAITEEWKQMLQSTRQQQMLASGEGGEGERRAKQTRESTSTQKLLYTRFEDLTVSDLHVLHSNYKSLLGTDQVQ